LPQSSRWPHRPTKLSDLIDEETLSVLISGSCARLGRALTVLDYDRKNNECVSAFDNGDYRSTTPQIANIYPK
jgi:hypothetical protein